MTGFEAFLFQWFKPKVNSAATLITAEDFVMAEIELDALVLEVDAHAAVAGVTEPEWNKTQNRVNHCRDHVRQINDMVGDVQEQKAECLRILNNIVVI